MLDWLVYAAIGKLVIYLWMKFPLPFRNDWIEKLHNCDLCSGVWIYCLIAVLFGVDIIQDTLGHTASIAGELVTGALTSFVVYIFSAGWREVFSPPIVI